MREQGRIQCTIHSIFPSTREQGCIQHISFHVGPLGLVDRQNNWLPSGGPTNGSDERLTVASHKHEHRHTHIASKMPCRIPCHGWLAYSSLSSSFSLPLSSSISKLCPSTMALGLILLKSLETLTSDAHSLEMGTITELGPITNFVWKKVTF